MTVLPGTLFSYLSAFITIIVALALSDMVISLHRMVRARARVTWRPIPLLAAAVVALTLQTEFFELWRFTRTTQESFYGLIMAMSEPLLVFLAAAAVLPDEVPAEGLDLDTFYYDDRAYIWTAVLISTLANLAINALDRPERFTLATPDGWRFVVNTAILLGLNVPLIWSRKPIVHWVCLSGTLMASLWGFAHWTITGASALSAP